MTSSDEPLTELKIEIINYSNTNKYGYFDKESFIVSRPEGLRPIDLYAAYAQYYSQNPSHLITSNGKPIGRSITANFEGPGLTDGRPYYFKTESMQGRMMQSVMNSVFGSGVVKVN